MAKKEVDLRERLANDVLKIVETHEALIETIDERDHFQDMVLSMNKGLEERK